MGIVQLPDDLRRVIDRQVLRGRAASEAEFLAAAVQHYADALEFDEDTVIAAADDGIADIEAGRFITIASSEDLCRLRTEIANELNHDGAVRSSDAG